MCNRVEKKHCNVCSLCEISWKILLEINIANKDVNNEFVQSLTKKIIKKIIKYLFNNNFL